MTTTTAPQRIREIPYNYTSYTDREIVVLATIASLGDGVEAQLGSHMKNTHSLGVSSAELQKIVDAIKIVNSDNGARAQRVLDGLKLQ